MSEPTRINARPGRVNIETPDGYGSLTFRSIKGGRVEVSGDVYGTMDPAALSQIAAVLHAMARAMLNSPAPKK